MITKLATLTGFTVTAWVALAVWVFASVTVAVIVKFPVLEKVCVALVALFANVSTALPSPQLTVKPVMLEPETGAALMVRVYRVLTVTLLEPLTLMVGLGKVTATTLVALAVWVFASVAVTEIVKFPALEKV